VPRSVAEGLRDCSDSVAEIIPFPPSDILDGTAKLTLVRIGGHVQKRGLAHPWRRDHFGDAAGPSQDFE
jgi:hypothetical protein